MQTRLESTRRAMLAAGLAWGACRAAQAAVSKGQGSADAQAAAPRPLGPADAQAFRAWFCAILEETVRRGPSPRWVHRDCAGLVRFAAREALLPHEARWLASMGWPQDRPLPPDVELGPADAQALTRWTLPDGARSDFAGALALVQGNTRPVGKDGARVLPGDLLFFDQGADQHLMAWTGRRIIYHTGAEPTPADSGLRSTTLGALLRHPDTRWRPEAGNPNFAGWFRFRFLA
ncbi:DUF1175 family protein [Ramlibacter sp. G-1-2-2]|uniref:DUF1175 family protein n=1 Tax=Ramlibacter agri TaxID=2728837 RepID=A0A848GXZ8_9BURK|nr:DUF1175 family protein [Ramlibacter agri]NML43224.1 DUF1175 family protein [Ramlibacter agri]